MDANKVTKMGEIGYTVRPCCALCVQGSFAANNDWGTCSAHTYEHKKHSASKRQLSIHKAGVCASFRADLRRLGAYHCLFERETNT